MEEKERRIYRGLVYEVETLFTRVLIARRLVPGAGAPTLCFDKRTWQRLPKAKGKGKR